MMTTPVSLRVAFQAQDHVAVPLVREIKSLMKDKPNKWFFDIRRKKFESFSAKIQTGKVVDIGALEDFVACMIVVPLESEIPKAIEFLEAFMTIVRRRPESTESTLKPSSSFVFDDLRLFGHLSPPQDLPPRAIDNMVFEVQVKTFLQHAWSVATHDLVYKYHSVSWARNRVSYQVKAALEQAEMSLATLDLLEDSGYLAHDGFPERAQQFLISYCEQTFDPSSLPEDKRRMAMNLGQIFSVLDINEDDEREQILEEGRSVFGGHPAGWEPYQALIEYLSILRATDLYRALSHPSPKQPTFFASDEVLARLGLSRAQAVGAATWVI